MSTKQKDLIDTEELINNLDEELNEQQKELRNELLNEQLDIQQNEELHENLDEQLNEQRNELQNELLNEQLDIQKNEELHENLDEELNDEVKFGSDKEEIENISTELLPPEPQKPNAKKILSKSKEELEDDLKVSIDREKYLKDTKDEMFKSFEKKGNVYFLEGKNAIKVEKYKLKSNKEGVKNTSCSPYSSPLVFAKSLSDVKVKHIGKFPIVEGGLESLEQAFLLIQEKDLFDLNEITIGDDVDPSVKEMLERLKNKNNVELGLDQDNKQDKTASNDDVNFGDNKQESTQTLEDKKQDQTKPTNDTSNVDNKESTQSRENKKQGETKATNELTDDDIANFGDYGACTLDEAIESDPDLINHIDQKVIEKNIKQFDEDNLDDLDLDCHDISKNKYSTSSAVSEEEASELQSLDFDEDQLEADSVLDFDDNENPDSALELDDDPAEKALDKLLSNFSNNKGLDENEKPDFESEKPEKMTALKRWEVEKSDMLMDLEKECRVDEPEPKSEPENSNKNTKASRLSNRP
jgi:hypothetical protein